jgi:hypothetical protein
MLLMLLELPEVLDNALTLGIVSISAHGTLVNTLRGTLFANRQCTFAPARCGGSNGVASSQLMQLCTTDACSDEMWLC